MEELNGLLAQGTVSATDIIIKDDGDELAVGAFLQQSRPLKLKVLPPAVPEPCLSSPLGAGEPPILAPSTAQKNPRMSSAGIPPQDARHPANDEEKPLGNIVWITVVTGVVCLWCNFRLVGLKLPEANLATALGIAVGRTLFCTLLCVGLRALRPNLRTRRAIWISVMLGFILGILIYLKVTLT